MSPAGIERTRSNPLKLLIIFTLISFLTLPIAAFAEIKVVTHTLKQPFGGSQSPDDARIAGVAKAKREALEQFGTYIESTTVVKEAMVDSDVILALTAGVTKAEVIKQKNYTDGDAFGIEITVKVELDTAVLDKSLKRLLEDRNHLKDLTAAREREKELLSRIVELEKENLQKGKTSEQSAELKKEFLAASQVLKALEFLSKAYDLSHGEKSSNPEKAIEYLTQAIRLAPEMAAAYLNRGVEYGQLKQQQKAIADFDQAIRFDPNLALAYYNRGLTYADLKQLDRAIEDYDQAMRLDPNYALTYLNRGNAYAEQKKFGRAIADFEFAIRVDPNDAKAYYNRGLAYTGIEKFSRAIVDFDQAINLDTNLMLAYHNRGTAYAKLQQNDLAILDFNHAINLDPKNASTYSNRGVSYLMLNQAGKGCADLKKACNLGDCKSYESVRKVKLCK